MSREGSRNIALLGMFLASGCSALIYEIVWFQQLSLVLGASAVSLAILLTSFMGGMCIGSLGFSRWVSQRHHPLIVYAALELIIAVCALGTLLLFPVVGRIYCQLSLAGTNDLIARSTVALLLLLPPTAMMGATLPAVSRWVESTRTGMAWLGWFYGANTLGAVVGSLLAGMHLLRVYDVVIATYVAVAMNIGVALIAFWLARLSPGVVQSESILVKNEGADASSDPPYPDSPFRFGAIHFAIGLSGLTALGAEVVWTRYLGLLLGPTVYTFSIILAVFLLGLGAGSSVGAVIGRRIRSPALALAFAQLLLIAAIPYAAWMIVKVVPSWLALHGPDERFMARLSRDMVRTAATFFPAACLWGASFPLAVAAMAGQRRDPSRLVGGLYAANTFGAIVGSLGISLIAIPYGGQFVQQFLTAICGISGMMVFAAIKWPALNWRRHEPGTGYAVYQSAVGSVLLVTAAIGCLIACRTVAITPAGLLADGRYLNRWDSFSIYLYVAEGLDSPIVVSDLEDGTRCFHVAGKIEASTTERDIRTQRLLGHLPAMAHPAPKKVLVVGCGSGMTAGSFLLHPSVEEIVLCEMEKCVIEASRENFADFNYGVLKDPRTRIVHDDARHFLATTRETFDIITTDPIHPWVKGAATLYTAEFFQLCKSHLGPDGIVTLWVPLYESSEATVKCEMATFLQEFPEATIWSGLSFTVGYDLVVVGSAHGQRMDAQQMASKILSNPSLRMSFADVGLGSVDSLLKSFAATGHDLKPWLNGAEINRDRNLRLQYLAGTNPSDVLEQHIFEAMTASREVPAKPSVPAVRVRTPEDF